MQMYLVRCLTRLLKNRKSLVIVLVAIILSIFYIFSTFSRPRVNIYTPLDLLTNYPLTRNLSHWTCDNPWPQRRSGVLTKLFPKVDKSCSLLWGGDKRELRRVKNQLSSWKNILTDKEYLQHYLSNCTTIRTEFDNFYVSSIERDFPLAFLFNVHTSIQQVVRFLKAVYRPHNFYCFHVDVKASQILRSIVTRLSQCLPNVVSARKVYDIMYATIDQVDGLRSCYKELLQRRDWKWKYAINLCGRELPLKTNLEIVQILKGMKSNNVINPGVLLDDNANPDIKRRIIRRIRRRPIIGYTNEPLGPVPYNIPVYKNTTFVAVTREFVNFLFLDDKANDLYLFLRDTKYPDEQYFVTINHFPEAPGGYQELERLKLIENIPQVSVSYWLEGAMSILPQTLQVYFNITGRCYDKFLAHSVCIVNCGDLLAIKSDYFDSRVLFFNKYLEGYDHVVMDCVEEELVERNRKEFIRDCPQQQVLK